MRFKILNTGDTRDAYTFYPQIGEYFPVSMKLRDVNDIDSREYYVDLYTLEDFIKFCEIVDFNVQVLDGGKTLNIIDPFLGILGLRSE